MSPCDLATYIGPTMCGPTLPTFSIYTIVCVKSIKIGNKIFTRRFQHPDKNLFERKIISQFKLGLI